MANTCGLLVVETECKLVKLFIDMVPSQHEQVPCLGTRYST